MRIGASAFLGVELASADAGDYADPERAGATISGVTAGGSADQAGLEAGDTVTAVGSAEVESADELRDVVADLEPGQEVTLEWVTAEGSNESATVTLGASAVA